MGMSQAYINYLEGMNGSKQAYINYLEWVQQAYINYLEGMNGMNMNGSNRLTLTTSRV